MLLSRGHEVEVVTTADRVPALEAYPVHWASRSLPRGVRHARAVQLIAAAARRADVVYSTGMLGRSALGSALVHAPIVQKLTSDPTYERSIRYGLYGGDLDSFQRSGGWRVRTLRSARNLALRRTSRILIPSESLGGLAAAWGIRPERIEVLPNPVERPATLEDRDELRRRHGLDGPTLVFAGRLSVQKAVDVALDALTRPLRVCLLCQYVSTLSGWEVSFSWRCLPPIGGFRVLLLTHILRFIPTSGSIYESVRTTNGRNGWCSIPPIRERSLPRSLCPSQMSFQTRTSPKPSNAVHSTHSQRWKGLRTCRQQKMTKHRQSVQSRDRPDFVCRAQPNPTDQVLT